MTNKKILIVDDDPDVRRGMNVRLKALPRMRSPVWLRRESTSRI
jgi:hypothetical protein